MNTTTEQKRKIRNYLASRRRLAMSHGRRERVMCVDGPYAGTVVFEKTSGIEKGETLMDALHIMTVITLALIGIMIMSVLFYVCEVGLACRTWPLRIVTYTLILGAAVLALIK